MLVIQYSFVRWTVSPEGIPAKNQIMIEGLYSYHDPNVLSSGTRATPAFPRKEREKSVSGIHLDVTDARKVCGPNQKGYLSERIFCTDAAIAVTIATVDSTVLNCPNDIRIVPEMQLEGTPNATKALEASPLPLLQADPALKQ
jgi:hypothetical protein